MRPTIPSYSTKDDYWVFQVMFETFKVHGEKFVESEKFKSIGNTVQSFKKRDSGCSGYVVKINPVVHQELIPSFPKMVFLKVNYNQVGHTSLIRFKRLYDKLLPKLDSDEYLLHHFDEIPLNLKTIFPTLLKFEDSINGLVFCVLEFVEGENLYEYESSISRDHPDSPHSRFRRLPVLTIIEVLTTIFQFFVILEDGGNVANDFYDGNIIYNFETNEVRLIDLDEFREGSFELKTDRGPGSKRMMARKEWIKASLIDHQSNVYTLGTLH